jgi:hypothetical protein
LGVDVLRVVQAFAYPTARAYSENHHPNGTSQQSIWANSISKDILKI